MQSGFTLTSEGGDIIIKIKQTTLRLPTKLFDVLHKQAKAKGLTLNALLLHILWEWVD